MLILLVQQLCLEQVHATETGHINFTEKDGGAIELDYNQNLAYSRMSSAGVLASNLTTTPALAEINLKSSLTLLLMLKHQ